MMHSFGPSRREREHGLAVLIVNGSGFEARLLTFDLENTIMEPYRYHENGRAIMNFTLKNIPNDIYEKIKTRAERNHRSMNGEIITILGEMTRPRTKNSVEILALADELRARTKGFLTDEFLRKAKRDGRP